MNEDVCMGVSSSQKRRPTTTGMTRWVAAREAYRAADKILRLREGC